jgi:hypothetical protein
MVFFSQLTPQRPQHRLKVVNPTSLSTTTFSSHDGNFEPMVEILPVRIKGQD